MDYCVRQKFGLNLLYKAQCGNLKRLNFFTERIVNVWNSLPANVDFSSLPRFKKSIIQVDLAQFLKCNVQWIIPVIKFRSFYFTSSAYVFFLFCVLVFSIMNWMYVLSYQLILGYGQLLVLDESLSVLLIVSWYCCNGTGMFEQIKWWWWWWWHSYAPFDGCLLRTATLYGS